MSDCSGWVNPENMHNSTKAEYSTQTYRDIAIDDIEKQIEIAKKTPVPAGLWGTQIYWDTEYCTWVAVDGSDKSDLIDFPVGIIGKNEDDVNHPSHYCNRSMEAIDIIEMIISIEKNPKVAYNMSNVLKYLLRFRDKGQELKDLEKARWYLNRMIKKVGEEVSPD